MNHIFTTVQNNRNSSFFRLFSELLWSPSWHWCTSSTSTFTPTQSGIVILERCGRSGQSTPGRCSHGGRGRRATFKRCEFKSGGRGISSWVLSTCSTSSTGRFSTCTDAASNVWQSRNLVIELIFP